MLRHRNHTLQLRTLRTSVREALHHNCKIWPLWWLTDVLRAIHFKLMIWFLHGSSCTVLTWNFCDSQPVLSHGHVTHSVEVNYHVCCKCIQLDIFTPRGPIHTDAKVCIVLTRTCRHSVFVKYLNALIYVEWLVQAYIRTHMHIAVSQVWGSLKLVPIKLENASTNTCLLANIYQFICWLIYCSEPDNSHQKTSVCASSWSPNEWNCVGRWWIVIMFVKSLHSTNQFT